MFVLLKTDAGKSFGIPLLQQESETTMNSPEEFLAFVLARFFS